MTSGWNYQVRLGNCSFGSQLDHRLNHHFVFRENMAKNGEELELKDSAGDGSKTPVSPSRQPTNYDSLKELNANNGKLASYCL